MLHKAVALLIRIRIIRSCSAPLAQLDRARPSKDVVEGSNPSGRAIIYGA